MSVKRVVELGLNFVYSDVFAVGLVLADLVLSFVIVTFVPYTEIDWIAYMQEVEGVLGGEYDYTKLKGDTGPLVYPAGFVYVFIFIRWLTDAGENIKRAQYIFAVLHSFVVAVLLTCFRTVRKENGRRDAVPFWVGILLIASRRIHSIFALRLFNDCVMIALVYVAILLCLKRRWSLGVLVFSFAASIKMNVILFVPGLAVLLVQSNGFLKSFLLGLMFFSIQVILALPFLLENPAGYVGRAVEVGRVFMYKWTVNYKFLSEETFVSKSKELAIVLTCMTLLTWLAFGHFKWARSDNGLLNLVIDNFTTGRKKIINNGAEHILTCLFTSNFIGIVFFRSLHYQFYCWYYHTLGFLVLQSKLPNVVGILLIIAIEISFNVYPATPISSILLQCSHMIILVGLWFSPCTKTSIKEANKED